MKPSLALDAHREEIRRIVAANRGLNPRVFGSVLHRDDTEASDLDLLIDAAEGMTLFDMAAMSKRVMPSAASINRSRSLASVSSR